MNKLLIPILVGLVLIGCNTDKNKEPKEIVNQEFGNIQNELIDSLKTISDNNQSFKIFPTELNTIVGKEGTILVIPKNSIVDQNGNNITEEITIQLKENFSISDYILSNLQTIHNDRILESKGMIYFTAQDEKGNELQISKNKTIRLQIPQKDFDNNPEIFLGNRTGDGLMNWGDIDEQAKTLIPFPIKFISKNRFSTECSDHYGITTDTIKNKNFNYYGSIYDFENTLLSTNEFNIRYNSACWSEVVNIYIENINKNLWEIDEMVVDYLIQDSTERVDYYLNNVPPGVNGKPRTKVQEEAHEWLINNTKSSSHRSIDWFKKLAAQKLTIVDSTKLIDPTKLAELNPAFISYDAMKFGWVNVDFFFEDPKAVPVKLIAKTNQKAPLINLIIQGRNVILSGSEHSVNEYWFTKNEDGYNKLPKGEKATIIAIGLNTDGVLFGEKEIIIGEIEIEKIEMKAITGKELKKKLENYGS